MEQKSILIVGSLNMDQVVSVPRMPAPGETLLSAGSVKLVPGGKGANQAVAMARLGGQVAMAGRVGSDPFGERLLQALQADGVDTALIAVDQQEASGTAFIFLGPHGENAIIVAPGANMRVGADAAHLVRIEQALASAAALVLQMEIPLTTVMQLIEAGHRAALPVVLNAAPAQPLPASILRQVDVLIVNETEAQTLVAALQQTPAPVRSSEGLEPEAARTLALELHAQGSRTVVVTLGRHGALLVTREATGTRCLLQPAPTVQVVDTTAAGDCFVGALTVALLAGRSPEEALRFAVYAGTLKVTRFGAQSGLPTRSEVERFLQTG
jgi:ribokinase